MAETTTTGPRIDNLNATLSRSPQEGDDDNVVDYTINESGGDGRGVHLHLIKNSLTNQYPGNYILYRGTVNGKDRASSVAVTINADGHMVSISVAKYLFFVSICRCAIERLFWGSRCQLLYQAASERNRFQSAYA